MQEAQVPSLGWEDPLEKEMATQSSVLAWEGPWTEVLGGLYWDVGLSLGTAQKIQTSLYLVR